MSDHSTNRTRQAPSQTWMITFADLLSLMLAFFVLLFAMSKIEAESWKTLVEAFSSSLNPLNQWTRPMLETAPEAPKLFTKRAMDLDYLSGVLQAKMADSDILGQGILYRQDDSLVLSLPGDLLFDPGQARLHANTHEAMVSLGTTLKLVGNSLEIIGHAEATPPPSDSPYSSNWDLSLARALALANALHAVGYADMIKALGAADGGAREISEKLPEAQRQSLSRRVDLVIREASLEGAGNGQ